jgi:hypothetical protein
MRRIRCQLLARVPGVVDVQSFGQRARAGCRLVRDASGALTAVSSAKDCPSSVRAVAALEDVFIDMVGQSR